MAVKIATKELVDYFCLGAITVYTVAEQFDQPVLATVATELYLHTASLFNTQQPHQYLFVIACVPPGRYETNSIRLQETFTQHLIETRIVRYRLEKYFYIPYVNAFASKHSARMS